MDTSGVVLLVAGILVLFAIIYFVARNEVVRRRLACPRTGAVADVEVVRRFEGDKKPVRVRACDQLPDPHEVDCDQGCLKDAD